MDKRKATIERLKKAAKDLEQKEPKRYLRSSAGKQLLKEAIDLQCGWLEMKKIFGRSKSTLEKILGEHQISKPRNFESEYSDVQNEIIKNKYEKSTLVKSKDESDALSGKMLEEINLQRSKEGKKTVSRNAVSLRANHILGLKWGWPNNNKKELKTEEKLSLAQKEAILREESMAAKRFELLFGDLKKIPRMHIPKTSGETPFEIEIKDKKFLEIACINSPLVGTLSSKNENLDIFKNSLRFAEAKKIDAVIITGNLFYCMVEKYGKQRPYRTQIIGLEPDPKLLESVYPPAVLQEIGPLIKRIDSHKIIFMTIKVYLDQIFQIIKKKFSDENGSPIFKGKIYINLGEIEEEVAMYYANEALRAEVFQEKAFANRKIRELRLEMKAARQAGNDNLVNNLLQGISDWQIYAQILTTMGNISPDVINDRRQQMVNYLAFRIESDIPNAKVIGIGDTFIKVNKQLISIVNDKVSDSVSGGLAGRLREKVNNFIKAHQGERVPYIILGSGLNPWGVGLYVSYRIRSKKLTLDDVRMSNIIQLKPCINSDLYRETVRRMVKARDKIARLASTMNFQSGITILKISELEPILAIKEYISDFLGNGQIFGSAESLTSFADNKDNRSKMIYSYKEGCVHFGASYIARYDSPDDPNGRYTKLHDQVLFEAFVRDNIPIHMYQVDGDIQHWLNYQTYKEGNPKWRDPEQMLAEFNKIEKDANISFQEKLKMFKKKSLDNMLVAGVIQPEDQIELYGRALAPYCDFFKKIIERAKESCITVDGNLGVISIGQGNHNEHTFKGDSDVRFSEAKLTRKEIILMLLKKGYNPEGLDDYIIACQMGGLGMANGIFKAGSLQDKTYEYCIFMKHKHGSSKIKDNMLPMIRKFSQRGTTDDYEEGRFTINLGGDDHMGGYAVTRNAFHYKTGGQMFSGPFGLNLDFPKQNIFSGIWGVPAGGPAWGPFFIVNFDFRITRKLAAYKIVIPKDVFENPL